MVAADLRCVGLIWAQITSLCVPDVVSMSHSVEDETTINESYSITVPASVREELDLGPGDKLRWAVDESGELSVEVVRQRTGAFSELEPVDVGETHAAEDHDLVAGDG